MVERIRARRVAEITGLSLRSVQASAIRGEIPSAAKFGKTWTFNERAVREWVAAKEKETIQKAEWTRQLIKSLGTPSFRPGTVSPPNYGEIYERLVRPNGRDSPICNSL